MNTIEWNFRALDVTINEIPQYAEISRFPCIFFLFKYKSYSNLGLFVPVIAINNDTTQDEIGGNYLPNDL